MLASQFLNVVMDENSENKVQDEHDSSRNSEDDDDDDDETNNNLLNNIFKTNLPSVLLSECTIELCSQTEKKKVPELRFEASLSPSKKPRFVNNDVDILPFTIKDNTKEDTNNMDVLLQGVEAVYSDGDSHDEDDDSSEGTPCPHCGRMFFRNCSLTLHIKWHCTKAPKTPEVTIQPRTSTPPVPPPTPVRAYRCDVCGKSYAHKSVLKKHSVVHTGERLKCTLCGIEFTQRSSLLRHCKRIHKISSLPD